jgi:TonB-linked SusC/RagA family outer membrane protein
MRATLLKQLPLLLFMLFVTATLLAQQRTVTGKIIDQATGNPLSGATVNVKGTSRSVSVGASGDFSVTVSSPNDVLVISYVGYTTQEVAVGKQSSITVSLANTAANMNEVVVVGYGNVRKKDLTGAVAALSNEDIVKRGTTSPLAAIQGQVAGVTITSNTGLPGSDLNINIRGANSLTGSKPLFVVDGVMIDNINFLNPNDIERIDILKDASSTAIYGSRGSNGVVIVTTRSGKKGKASLQYSGFVGLRTIANMPDFLNVDEAIEFTMNRGIMRNIYTNQPIQAPDDLYGFPSSGTAHDYWVKVIKDRNFYDWIGEEMKPSVQHNHFISASGGSDKLTYLVGAGYQGDDGNVRGQSYKKYNFKANFNGSISEKWATGANINIAYSDRELRGANLMQQLFRMPPYAPAYDSAGEMIRQPMLGISGNVSPLAVQKYNKDNTQEYYLVSNFYLQFKPQDWLFLKSTFSPTLQMQRRGTYRDALETGSNNVGSMATTNNFSYVWDNQAHVTKSFGEHRLDYDFINSLLMFRREYLYGFGNGLPFNSEFYNLRSATQFDVASNYQKNTLLSFTNRLNYAFMDKYLVTATARWDGSSKLAPGHKWAFFPSVGLAWRMSDENFLQSARNISLLKLRTSFGYTGNDNIDPYQTQLTVDRQTYYDWNGRIANGFRPSALANQALTWERTREWNVGLDFGFFNNRISGELNLYDKMSLNLLMERKLAVPTGWANMLDNVGSVSNRGVELQFRTVNISTRDFKWETGFNFAYNKNKIVELYGKKEDDVANRWFIGQPVDVVYALEFDGIWQKHEVPAGNTTLEGTARVKDLDKNGVIDLEDMRVLGSPMPKWTGGFNTNLTYKNWDLSANLYTAQGIFLFSPFHREFTDFNSKQILDVPYYMRDNPVTKARYSNTYPQPSYMGQYWGEDAEDYGYPGFNKDASFVRLQNITLGYSIASSVLGRLGIQNARFYINLVNPKVWTKYDGFDPEWGGASMTGANANSTAFSLYQLGANIKF